MERKWWSLLAVCLATFMLLLDITVVNVALPDIQKDLNTDLTGLQWVVDAYTLTLAAFTLTMGTLADRFGRRRLFMIGVGLFTLASLLCGLATDVTFLHIARLQLACGLAVERDLNRLAARGVPHLERIVWSHNERPRGQRVGRDEADHVALHAPGQDRSSVGEVVAGRARRRGDREPVAADATDLVRADRVGEIGDAIAGLTVDRHVVDGEPLAARA